jgi:hypothetical protein
MDTIVLRTVSFVGRTIRVQRTSTGFSRSQGHEGALSPTRVVPHPGQGPLAAEVPPPSSMVDGSGTAMAGCSVVDNLPLFLWHIAAPTPENPGVARSRRGILSHLQWEQIGLLLGSVGSDIRRV